MLKMISINDTCSHVLLGSVQHLIKQLGSVHHLKHRIRCIHDTCSGLHLLSGHSHVSRRHQPPVVPPAPRRAPLRQPQAARQPARARARRLTATPRAAPIQHRHRCWAGRQASATQSCNALLGLPFWIRRSLCLQMVCDFSDDCATQHKDSGFWLTWCNTGLQHRSDTCHTLP